MEPKGKTSFVPKKPIVEKDKKNKSTMSSLFFVISFVIFALTLAGAGGVYFYKKYVEKSINQKKQYLEESKQAFEPSLIRKLKELDERIQASRRLLNNHIAPSAIFSTLEVNTLKTISFKSVEYRYKESSPKINMTGEALGFNSVALQSDVFGEEDFFQTPIFSDLGVNNKGRVSFNFSSDLKVASIMYNKNLREGFYKENQNTELENKVKSSTSTSTSENN